MAYSQQLAIKVTTYYRDSGKRIKRKNKSSLVGRVREVVCLGDLKVQGSAICPTGEPTLTPVLVTWGFHTAKGESPDVQVSHRHFHLHPIRSQGQPGQKE